MNFRHNLFNPLWLRDPDFKRWVGKVPSSPHKARCLLCERDFVIGDEGHHALKAHASSSRHKMRVQMNSRLKHEHRSPDRSSSHSGSSNFGEPMSHREALQLSRYERDEQLVPLLDNGWNMVDGRDAIRKTFLFQSFSEAWSWMSRVALAGERMGHHPEWFNVYNSVEITWVTPDCNGISARDVKMAHFCDSAYKNYK